MIKSMTGYGRAESFLDGRKMVVEIKSLNHRFLEIYIRLPSALSQLEMEIKKKIGDRFSRGRIEAGIRMDSGQEEGLELELELNRPLVRQYYDLFKKLKEEFSLAGDINLEMLAGMKDIITPVEKESNMETVWLNLEKTLEEAMNGLESMRKKEGESLCKDLVARMGTISGSMEEIGKRAPQVVLEYQKRLSDRVKELSGGLAVDESRLAQEVAIMADRSDITEEVVRFASHTSQLKTMLKGNEPVGRKIDFLLQEMNREVNTIGSKTNDVDIANRVVDIKSELSKLREQIQNIE